MNGINDLDCCIHDLPRPENRQLALVSFDNYNERSVTDTLGKRNGSLSITSINWCPINDRNH
ncbi:hypothetical protein BLOT_007694 [Blomia tropicalis]|nr:hypothetical protein BLOT_007694 [Blomia tropicalis]